MHQSITPLYASRPRLDIHSTSTFSLLTSCPTPFLETCIRVRTHVLSSTNTYSLGESGLGKTTLINTLFSTELSSSKNYSKRHQKQLDKLTEVEIIKAELEVKQFKTKLTVIDTPGFGDFINNDESWDPIVKNIEQRFDAYLEAENKVNRMNVVDNRIHAVVYFIQPTGHSLKPLDIEVMRRLHNKVNLIPVIAKADTLTDEEIASFKARVRSAP